MSSVIFNPSMLTASPSPSPEPEECPQDGGNALTNDTTFDDPAPSELEESEDRIQHAWAAPLEEQESWLHDWNTTMNDMNAIFKWAHAANTHMLLENTDTVDLDKGKAAAKSLTKAIKALKQKAEESALTVCPAHAEKEKKVETLKAVDKGKGKEKVAEPEKATLPIVTDMGHPRFGRRITAMSVTYPEEPCAQCAAAGSKCVLSNTSLQCHGCIKARKACSFVANKAKERALAVPKTKEAVPAAPKAKTPVPVAPKATTPAPVPAPKAKGPAPASVIGESDMEIIGMGPEKCAAEGRYDKPRYRDGPTTGAAEVDCWVRTIVLR
ncbi:hypothetical protein C8R48DRAFT_668106 [Suillus tomentosus]|nr:hypothetical protein C8R48DRAFT_668106 [Suillus tomentosus]